MLAKRISYSLQDALSDYNLNDLDIELFIMGRPWLSAEDFKIKLPEVTEILNEQIKNEIKNRSKLYSEKAFKLQNYEYKLKYMGDYGDPILDKNKNLIGYRINNDEYASVNTYYNENNLLCNKI